MNGKNICRVVSLKTKSIDGYLAKTRAIIDKKNDVVLISRIVLVPITDNEAFNDYETVKEFKSHKLMKKDIYFWTNSFEIFASKVLEIVEENKTPIIQMYPKKNKD